MINHTTVVWGGFILFIIAMLAIDLGLFQRKRHVMSMKEALTWFGIWVGLAMLFNVGLFFFHERGAEAGLEYFAGYLIEKSLSVDNIFIFVLVFTGLGVPRISQPKVLLWGVLGAIVFRAIFIVGGLALLKHFHWMMYLFGAFLLVTGVRMMRKHEDTETDPKQSWAIRTLRRFIPITGHYDRDRFFTRENGKLSATPLLVALIAIESADIVFAVDSIPAILAVTDDPYIVFTSNIFAMLGLRSLYFAIAGVLGRFYFLRYGFAAILLILSAKMLLADVAKVPIALSIVLIVFILLLCMIISLLRPRRSDLKGLFARTARLGLIPFRRLLVIENVIDHGDLPIREVMRPREQVRVVRLNAAWAENLQAMRKARFARYPIVEREGAKPLGILHVQDLVLRDDTSPSVDLRELARPAQEFRDEFSLTEALGRFRPRANDMGLVLNQRGEWIGIVTLEDILEQLVGEIDDKSPGRADEAQLKSVADALSPGRVLLDFDADSMNHAIETVIAAISEGELPAHRRAIVSALTRHTEQMTTYLGKTVAVPHARLDGIKEPFVVFARSAGGFDMGHEHDHAEILFLVLTPTAVPAAQPHLLGEISRLIGSDYVLEQLKTALTPNEIIDTLRVGEQVVPT